MPSRPSSDPGRRGRSPGRGRPKASGDRPSEGPPWKRRAGADGAGGARSAGADRPARSGQRRQPDPRDEADQRRGKAAGWGGVARKGAGRLRQDGPSGAADAFRDAAVEPWEPEVWIDEGAVRGEARGAVARGGRPPRPRRSGEEGGVAPDPSLRRAAGARADRMEARLKDASRAFRRERFDEARKILRPLAEAAPGAESVRELLGLTYYRLGRWKQAAAELEAFRDLSGSTEQHPVLADCYRALGRHAKVVELWEDLRAASPSAALVAEGRIVYAGSLADQGRLTDAIAALEAAKPPGKRPKDHHLRTTYALADLYERAGDVPRARQLFEIVALADPELGDVEARLRAL